MSKNNADLVLRERLVKELKDLRKEIQQLKTNQLNVIIVPKLATDPSSPTNGQIWYNTTSNKFKKYEGGTIKNWESA